MPNTLYIALLRGINVGGKNKLPMRELVKALEAKGCANVRTYVQSGNIVFSSSQASEKLPRLIEAVVTKSFGLDVPVVLRTAPAWRKALAANPYIDAGIDESQLHVAFLADKPAKAAVASLDSKRSPGDRYTVLGQEIYLHLPNGVARSKLTNAYFDAKLGTISTLRNWRTVLALRDMLSLNA